MIGIIGAMDLEVDGIKAMLTDAEERRISGISFVSGKINGHDAVAAKCGVGKINAALCTEAMILTYAPELIINVGVAGSLCPGLSIGDIVIAGNVCQHDFDTTPIGDPLGLIPEANLVKLPADFRASTLLAECASVCGIKNITGTIASGDTFVASSDKKDYIVSNFGAAACEMEGVGIGQVCYLNRVAFAVLRALSDDANESSHMDYPEFCRLAAANSCAVIGEFFKRI